MFMVFVAPCALCIEVSLAPKCSEPRYPQPFTWAMAGNMVDQHVSSGVSTEDED